MCCWATVARGSQKEQIIASGRFFVSFFLFSFVHGSMCGFMTDNFDLFLRLHTILFRFHDFDSLLLFSWLSPRAWLLVAHVLILDLKEVHCWVNFGEFCFLSLARRNWKKNSLSVHGTRTSRETSQNSKIPLDLPPTERPTGLTTRHISLPRAEVHSRESKRRFNGRKVRNNRKNLQRTKIFIIQNHQIEMNRI